MRERLAEALSNWGGLSWWSPRVDALIVVALVVATFSTVAYVTRQKRREEARRAYFDSLKGGGRDAL